MSTGDVALTTVLAILMLGLYVVVSIGSIISLSAQSLYEHRRQRRARRRHELERDLPRARVVR